MMNKLSLIHICYRLCKTCGNRWNLSRITKGGGKSYVCPLGEWQKKIKAQGGQHERLQPVSYTHLDVYKRQIQKFNNELRAKGYEVPRGRVPRSYFMERCGL